jgi:hypothetical protein
MKTVQVVFTGLASEIAHAKEKALELDDQATYRQIVQRLARDYPAMIGSLIAPDGLSFLSANLFSRENEEAIMPDQMDDQPRDGERLVILYFIVGG